MSSQPHAPDFTLLAAMPFQDQVEFGAVETAPRFARKRAATVLAEWGLADLEYPAGMIISELVTNSMRAARQARPHDRPPAVTQPVNRPTVGMLTASQPPARARRARQATAGSRATGPQGAELQIDNRPAVGLEPANQPPDRLRAAAPVGPPPIRVWMRGDPAGVYVLVHDGVPRAPKPRDAGDVDELDESGRGLAMIIPEFCAECGWYPTPDGKVTWALIRNPVPPAE